MPVGSLGDKRRHKALIDTQELNRTFEQMFAAPLTAIAS